MRIDEIRDLILIWGNISSYGIKHVKSEILYNNFSMVLVPEMRPYLLGLEIVEKLSKEGIDHVYATDNMISFLFYKGKIKKTVLFYKEIIKDGIIGISGSLYICILSKHHNISITLMKGDEIDFSLFSDKDALSIDGKLFFNDENLAIAPKDELIPWEILK